MKEFKEFAMKGNVIDLAIGVVIGAAFGKIVSSLVADIITPGLGLLIGGVNFSGLKIALSSPVNDLPPVTINYGVFLQSIFDFTVIALAMFSVIKIVNKAKKTQAIEEAAAHAVPTAEEKLLAEIRDILKNK
jgi:large conductance mechanosensitive channel